MSCGTCSLCCKVLDVPELNKPAGRWCPHCRPGMGCAVYETREPVCREWACVWLQSQERPEAGPPMAPELRPDRSHVVLVPMPDGITLNAVADPNYPDAITSGAMGRYLETYTGPLVVSIGSKRRVIGIRAA